MVDLAKTIEDYKKDITESASTENVTETVTSGDPTDNVTEVKAEEATQETVETKDEETKSNITVGLIDLFSWIEEHLQGLENYAKIKLQVAGVDEDTIVIKGPKVGSDASKKELFLLKDCKSIMVPNIPIIGLTIFKNNTMKFLSSLQIENHPDIFMKSYILGSGIINMLCVSIDDTLIPYAHLSVKRTKPEFELPMTLQGEPTVADYLFEILEKTPDYEGIELMYKQFGKVKDKLTTKIDIIKWLNKRQDESIDINHHLVIDKVLLSILEIS